MTKLLSANFYRMFRSRIFWALFLITPALNLYVTITNDEYLTEYGFHFADHLWTFAHTTFMGFLISALIGLIIGDEFSAGAVRSKLLAGHSRIDIYLSYYISSFTGMLVLHLLAVTLPVLFIFWKYGGSFQGIGEFLICLGYSIVPIAVQTAMILLVVCGIRKKSIGTISAFAVSVIVMVVTINLAPNFMAIDYLPENEIQMRAFLERILPDGYFNQIVSIEDYISNDIFQMIPHPITCGILGIIMLTAGLLIFRKIDLK